MPDRCEEDEQEFGLYSHRQSCAADAILPPRLVVSLVNPYLFGKVYAVGTLFCLVRKCVCNRNIVCTLVTFWRLVVEETGRKNDWMTSDEPMLESPTHQGPSVRISDGSEQVYPEEFRLLAARKAAACRKQGLLMLIAAVSMASCPVANSQNTGS